MRITFTATLRSDYHIGAGHGVGTQIDAALQRDADQFPVWRGAPKGLLRDGLWQLLQTPPLAHLRRCRDSGMPGSPSAHCRHDDLCPLCAIVGTPSQSDLRRWRFSSARPVGAEILVPSYAHWHRGKTGSQAASRVRVNPRLRRAEDKQLFTQEEGDKRLQFTFTAECAANDAAAHHQAAMLAAAARMVRRMGATRRRGRGACTIDIAAVSGWQPERGPEATWQDTLLQHFKSAWLDGEPPPVVAAPRRWQSPIASDETESKRFRMIVRLDEPCIPTRRAEAGNVYEGSQVIYGPTLLGALAAEAAKRWDLSQPETYRVFLQTFREGHVRVQPLYPVVEYDTELYPAFPVPRDLLVCKVAHRDLAHQKLKSYAVADCLPRACERCQHDIPMVSPEGFVAMHKGAELVTPRVREEFHPRIDPKTQRVATNSLFGYVALDSGQYLVGDLWCRDEAAWQTLCQLTEVVVAQTPFALRLGKATGRGYGGVSVWLEPVAADAVDPWRALPIEERVTSPDAPVTMTLLSDAIVPDAWGRFRQTFDADGLHDLFEGDIAKPIRAFCRSVSIDQFNNHLGLPRSRDIAIEAGSAVGFRPRPPMDLGAWQARLEQLEAEGIGLRRHEGYGQVVFNHPVYTQGHDLSGPSIDLLEAPALRFAPPEPETSPSEIKAAFDDLQQWALDSPLDAKHFRDPDWPGAARWLHDHAHLPVCDLTAQLETFGQAEGRSGKIGLAKRAVDGMKQLTDQLNALAETPPALRRKAIALLAADLAAAAKPKDD